MAQFLVGFSMDDGLVWQTVFSVVSVLAYTALAALLIWHTLHRFEIVAGRARSTTPPPPNPPTLPDQQRARLTEATPSGRRLLDAMAAHACPDLFPQITPNFPTLASRSR